MTEAAEHPTAFLAVPMAKGAVDIDNCRAQEAFMASVPSVRMRQTASLLCYNFNALYAAALNARAHGVTRFVMLHDDVVPEGGDWGRRLLDIMDGHRLGVLSAAVAIRGDARGETSTAIGANGKEAMRRLTRAEIGEVMTSRDQPRLLINTGCMAVDITQPWAERLYFRTTDAIVRDKAGIFRAVVEPEDWEMSRWLRREGVAFGVTTLIACGHIGRHLW